MVKIKFPRCIYCNSIDCFKCPVCGQILCIECFHDYDQDGNCMHSKFEAPVSTGWLDDEQTDTV